MVRLGMNLESEKGEYLWVVVWREKDRRDGAMARKMVVGVIKTIHNSM